MEEHCFLRTETNATQAPNSVQEKKEKVMP